MHLPRRLRQVAALDFDDEDDEAFRELLLAALASDSEVQAAIRRLTSVAKVPEPRAARRR
jgi:hypothetical protein